jgi:aspartate/methionine/tyrosine aminotransferase
MGAEGLLSGIRPEAASSPASGITDVFKHGFGKPGLIPLWAGEGDLPTPPMITEAAARSLAAGETFYTLSKGIPPLRNALATYHDRLYGGLFGKPFVPDRFFVTGSGMQAIQLAIRLVAGNGDEVLVPTPSWPNFAAAVGVAGGATVPVPLTFGNAGWVLDVDSLAAAITPRTRAIFINSPSNPTGWIASRANQQAILDLAREHGLWIIADEVYGRFVYGDEPLAPSFHALIEPHDRVLFVNTFSKNWAMTGWRVGWIEAPVELGPKIENLIQYSTSCVPTFVQRAATVALEEGEDFVRLQVARAKRGRDIMTETLGATGRVRFAPTHGAFYLFFSIDGETDVRPLAIRIIDEANVGLAPGTAFGDAGEGYLRVCFARGEESLTEAANRLADWIKRR